MISERLLRSRRDQKPIDAIRGGTLLRVLREVQGVAERWSAGCPRKQLR